MEWPLPDDKNKVNKDWLVQDFYMHYCTVRWILITYHMFRFNLAVQKFDYCYQIATLVSLILAFLGLLEVS